MARLETKAGEKLEMKILTINPALAKELLRTARRNRTPQRARQKRYASAMRFGEWVVAQPILLDVDGCLIDGQQRLAAVIEAQKPIDFLVVKGFDYENVFCKLDDGAIRTLKDWLTMNDEPHPKVMAAVIHMAARDLKGLIPTSRGAAFVQTPIKGVEFLMEHTEIRDSIAASGVVNRYIPWSMSAFCHWKFMQFDEALAAAFFIDLTMDDMRSEGDPIYILRERLKSDKRAKVKLLPTEKLALIYKAFNACRSGGRIKGLKWRSQGPTAEAFPEVI